MSGGGRRERDLARRVVHAGASNIVGRFVSIVVWFLLTPVILHAIGPGAYGLWVVATSLLSYGYLLDLGISATLTRDVSGSVARGAFEDAGRTIATAVRIQALFGALIVAIGAVLAIAVAPLLDVEPALRDDLPLVLVLMAATVGLSLAAGPLTSVLRGVQRYDLVNAMVIANVLLTAVGVTVVLGAGGGLVGMVAVTVPVTIATALLGIWLVRRAAPALRLGWAGGSRREGRRILGFSAPIFTVQVAGLLQTRTDEFIIGSVLSVGAVTPYALGRRLSEIPQIVGDQALKSLLPISAELAAGRELVLLKRTFISGTRIALALVAPLGLVIASLADAILRLWVGPEYADPGAVVAILVAAVVLDSALWPSAHVLQGIGRHRPLAVIALAAGLVNVAISIVLTVRFGLTGAALGTLLGHALGAGLTIPYALRVLAVTPGELVARIVLPALGPLLPAAAAIVAARGLLPSPGWFETGAIAAVGIGVYGLLYLAFGAGDLERRVVRDLVGLRGPGRGGPG